MSEIPNSDRGKIELIKKYKTLKFCKLNAKIQLFELQTNIL